MSYEKRVKRPKHGTFRWRKGGKQWIGGNQFVNAENEYEKKTSLGSTYSSENVEQYFKNKK